jgi:uncharacterized protein YaaQ
MLYLTGFKKASFLMSQSSLDRLMILTITGSQSDPLMKHLNRDGFQFTVINSTSEMMQESALCLMIGFSHERLSGLLEIIRIECSTYRKFIPTQSLLPGELSSLPMVEAELGGARVYILNVERFEQL